MKNKTLFGLFLVVCIAFSMHIFEVCAAQRQPSFFIPQKVLNNMRKQEKLPPIESITVNGQPNPVVVQQQQQKARAEALKKQQAEEAKKAEEQRLVEQRQQELQNKTKIAEERKKQEELAKNQKLQEEIARIKKAEEERQAEQAQILKNQPEIIPAETLENTDTPPTIKPKNIAAKFAPVEPETPIDTNENMATSEAIQASATDEMPPKINLSTQTSDEKNLFDALIADYEHDARGISKGEPVNNPRLRDVLKDYADDWHIL